MKNAAKMLKNNLGKLLAATEALTLDQVMVGIPQDRDPREEGEINNATIGYLMDKGMPERNVPAREWLRPGIAKVQPQIVKQLEWGAKQALEGNIAGPEMSLNRAGLVGQNGVRAYINKGIEPALAEATKLVRCRRGRTGTVPLVDTGQFRNSVTYVIRRKGNK